MKPPGANRFTGHANGLHLGVGGGVMALLPAVPAEADDGAHLVHDNAAHGHIAPLRRLPGQGKSLGHIFFVGKERHKIPPFLYKMCFFHLYISLPGGVHRPAVGGRLSLGGYAA